MKLELKLNKQDKTYGSIIIAMIILVAGAVLIFEDTEGTTYYLSEDGAEAKYECFDPKMKSDCINGIKASGARCYYDPDNGRRYKNCKGLWQEIKEEPVGNLEPSKGGYECRVPGYEPRCIPKQR